MVYCVCLVRAAKDFKLICVFTAAGTSWYASVFLVVNAGLGAGLLNFPAAYHACGGILVAVSIQAVSSVLLFCCTKWSQLIQILPLVFYVC